MSSPLCLLVRLDRQVRESAGGGVFCLCAKLFRSKIGEKGTIIVEILSEEKEAVLEKLLAYCAEHWQKDQPPKETAVKERIWGEDKSRMV